MARKRARSRVSNKTVPSAADADAFAGVSCLPAALRVLGWAVLGVVLGGAYGAAGSWLSALLAAVFAAGLVCAYRVDPLPGWKAVFGMGFGVYAAGFYWLPQVISRYGEISVWLAVPAAALLFAPFCLQFVLFEFLRRALALRTFKRWSLSLPSAWFAAEALFPKIIPWTLGQALLPLLIIAQAADLIGVSLLSFLLLWWFCLIADAAAAAAAHRKQDALRAAGLLVCSAAVCMTYGLWRAADIGRRLQSAPALDAIVVQPALPPVHEYSPALVQERMEVLRRLSREAGADKKADLIIWPESAVGTDYFPDDLHRGLEAQRDPFPGLTTPLLFGGQIRLRGQYSAKPQYYNAALLRLPDGRLGGMYRKQVLFPFSEAVPLAGVLSFPEKLRQRSYVLLAGAEEGLLEVPLRGSSGGLLRVAAAICFEDMWPEVYWESSRGGNADILAAVSNDAWFLGSAASREHQMIAAWRAIELRRSLIRATNDGLTAVVDPLGRTGSVLPQQAAGFLHAENIPVVKIDSLFSRFGVWPARLFAAMLFAAALVRTLSRVKAAALKGRSGPRRTAGGAR